MNAEEIAQSIVQEYGFSYPDILDSVQWEMMLTSDPSTIIKNVVKKELEELQF